MMFIFKHTRRAATVLMLAALGFSGLMAQGNDQKVYKVGDDGVAAPKLVKNIQPTYTATAQDAGITGSVVLSFEINKDGSTRNIKVVGSLEPSLDAEAAKAVAQWLFEPATREGQPVICSAKTEVHFDLR